MSDAIAMSFKARMNAFAKSTGLRPQTVIQSYMFERFLDRLSQSDYRDNFVLKGGVLISAFVGLQARATMDVDATVLELPMTFAAIRRAMLEVVRVTLDDGVVFSLRAIERIRLNIDGYDGIRAKLTAEFHGLKVPVSVDVTKGDAGAVVTYDYPRVFSAGDSIRLSAYSLERVLAEKCETILRRNIMSTRPRDLYDVFVLTRLCKISMSRFSKALSETCAGRGANDLLLRHEMILGQIRGNARQREFWRRYQNEFPYAVDISFEDAVEAVQMLLQGCVSSAVSQS